MLYFMLDVQSTGHSANCNRLNAWVNVSSVHEAMSILSEELSLQGWAVTDIIESTTTSESDYFAPCNSLDAFNEARNKLFALRFNDITT